MLAFADQSASTEEASLFSPKSWRQALETNSDHWSRTRLLKDLMTKTKLDGMERKNVLELLGEPQRSDELMPGSAGARCIDLYKLSQKNDQHFCVEYDNNRIVLSSYLEPTPLDDQKYKTRGKVVSTLSNSRWHRFLSIRGAEEILRLKIEDVKRELGEPSTMVNETSHAGGRQRHWLTYVYKISTERDSALIVIFDRETRQLYDYRLSVWKGSMAN
jgi:hypothetical protein